MLLDDSKRSRAGSSARDGDPSRRSIVAAEHLVDHRRCVGADGEVAGHRAAGVAPLAIKEGGVCEHGVELAGDGIDLDGATEPVVTLLAKEGQGGDGVATGCVKLADGQLHVAGHVERVVVLTAAGRVDGDAHVGGGVGEGWPIYLERYVVLLT
jgi:hypothetical protein